MQPSAQLHRTIDGVETDIVLQSYVDRVLILVTQLGKVGSLIQASMPETVPFPPSLPIDPYSETLKLVEPMSSIELTPLLGTAPSQDIATLHDLYVSQIATLFWTQGPMGDRRNVVVGLALKKQENEEVFRTTFTSIMRMFLELLKTQTAA